MFNRFFLPPDVYFRHWLVARNIGKTKSVLDVGGSFKEFSRFTKGVWFKSCDVTGGDIVASGMSLPFKKESFETVVSIDTLEHIPPEMRMVFIKELVRVASLEGLIVAPYASREHILYERRLEEKLREKGIPVPSYLKEHLTHGLIRETLIRSVVDSFG